MNLFHFQYGASKELEPFPHIREVALQRNSTVHLDSFRTSVSEDLRIYYILDGKFEWIINNEPHTLYPGDVALVLPGWNVGGVNGILELGTVFRLFIHLQDTRSDAAVLGEWSGLAGNERGAVTDPLLLSNVHILKIKEAGDLLYELGSEILSQEIGHITRVNHLIDTLLILIARHSSKSGETESDFSKAFRELEATLRNRPAHQWTVEEMAALFGLGTTAFTEKVKTHTGFSPLNYLINIRVSEAIKLLHNPHISFTDIAFETGFYSSQHFSTTFKRLTGYTPGEFRKRSSSNVQGQELASLVAKSPSA